MSERKPSVDLDEQMTMPNWANSHVQNVTTKEIKPAWIDIHSDIAVDEDGSELGDDWVIYVPELQIILFGKFLTFFIIGLGFISWISVFKHFYGN